MADLDPKTARICRSCSPVDAKKCDSCGALRCAHYRIDVERQRVAVAGVIPASSTCIDCVTAEDPGPTWNRPWLAARFVERDDDGLDGSDE